MPCPGRLASSKETRYPFYTRLGIDSQMYESNRMKTREEKLQEDKTQLVDLEIRRKLAPISCN